MTRKIAWRGLLLGLILLQTSAVVVAQGVNISGFGTASLSCFSSRTADFAINEQPRGAGRSGRCDTGLDSLLGVQLDTALSPTLDLGLQLVADRNPDRSFNPNITLAQLRWHATDALTLRFGRMHLATFLHEEDRKVHYAQPWVRPPLEVYGLVPPIPNDGLDFIHASTLGNWHVEWHGGASTVAFDTPIKNTRDTAPVESRQVFLSLSLRQENLLAKLSYGYSRVTLREPQMQQLLDFLRNNVSASLAEDLAIDDSPAHLLTLGLRREWNDWLLIGEFGYRTMQGFSRDQVGAYVTLGRRFGQWMPYATLARRESRGPDADSRAGFMKASVDMLLASTRYDRSSVSLGVSREICPKATLKLQADWTRPDSNSWGLYTNHAPDYNYAHPGTDRLLTLSLDFVF